MHNIPIKFNDLKEQWNNLDPLLQEVKIKRID